MSAMDMVEKAQMTERPAMKSGDTVKVHVKVREGDKERIQIFEGIIIGLHRGGVRASFTVRPASVVVDGAATPDSCRSATRSAFSRSRAASSSPAAHTRKQTMLRVAGARSSRSGAASTRAARRRASAKWRSTIAR